MDRNIFQISINIDVLTRLRDKINEENYISYSKEFYDKNKKKYRAWDKICAIMDRLDDTVDYLNQLKLNTGIHRRSAFDFFDFMNNAAVVVDCIGDLAKIFEVSDEEIKTSTEVFNELGNDGKGTDKKYFEYLRSLCSVHPVETSRHRSYQESSFECSPYVMWNDKTIWTNDDSDLYAVVYTSKDNDSFKRIHIHIDQIFEYVKRRVNFIENIIEDIEKYQQEITGIFRNTPIKKEEDFESYVDYLRNLKKEIEIRYGNDSFHELNYLIELFNLPLSNPANEEKMNLYKNALKYAIKFEHNSIQNMTNEGYKNNGILYPQVNITTTLLEELISLNSGSEERCKYSYAIEKTLYLSYDSCWSDRAWAYAQINEMMPFLERYVTFDKAESDFEHYVLVKLALYLECLENDCLINKNIPSYLNYELT
ncbi:hypothetical protein KWV42_10470 [Clostridioides difficile]|uniref:hypothetical protein n=1 Tax=Clostridioides difficile TaxID=1496 RepID=UPI0010B3EC23|nr:hypothetical protein [Clostridioides difficile]MBY1883510.1 hypothetical protein [Clostridioides difficile]MBZ0781371.1 hypothetical protein [Clostridioides difficile]MBZ0855015.1 hypothetical protein [Clostridioides difficile]MCG7701635.1 hypothetical protein [Clostridioides difficile]